MKYKHVRNQTRNSEVCTQCGIADNRWTGFLGLMGRASLEPGQGLHLVPCSSIHMFHMKFALDIIFLTKENIVTDPVENIAPGKIYVAKAQQGKAHSAVEVPVGVIRETATAIGDTFIFEDIPA